LEEFLVEGAGDGEGSSTAGDRFQQIGSGRGTPGASRAPLATSSAIRLLRSANPPHVAFRSAET